jgi:hypothetical protein
MTAGSEQLAVSSKKRIGDKRMIRAIIVSIGLLQLIVSGVLEHGQEHG